jgi:hypothetical protein
VVNVEIVLKGCLDDVAIWHLMYFDALEHLPENTGNQPFEVIAIALCSKTRSH